MSLRDQLNEDLKQAMRNKDTIRLNVIRSIKASILSAETKGQRKTLDEDGIVQVLAKELKERKESLPEFEKAGRTDLVDTLHQEIAFVMAYLPKPLSPSEIERIVEDAMTSIGASSPKDMGRVMGIVTPQVRGRADGRFVSEMVKARLQG